MDKQLFKTQKINENKLESAKANGYLQIITNNEIYDISLKTITQFDLQKIIIIIIILFSHYIVDFKQAYGIMKLLQQKDNICDLFAICFEKLG